MNILLCCEFFSPSVGGVQEVMKQLGQRFVEHGHKVTVATKKLDNRYFEELDGIKIKEFDVSGNLVNGLTGEVEDYRNFVLNGDFEVIMIKAAQQWTFDALWAVLDKINIPKVFIPCGFSALYEPTYAEYFNKMPNILKKFQKLIFYSNNYRDIDFARRNGINNYTIIPNGASEKEFIIKKDDTFKERYKIGKEDFVFFTNGSFTGSKGHLEVINAFKKLNTNKSVTLILNGNTMNLKKSIKEHLKYTIKKLINYNLELKDECKRISKQVNKQINKNVIITNLQRDDLIQAYLNSDLFVFASNVEYSPLVLFEAAAAGLPFLTVSVGNAEEIVNWTNGGIICPAQKDEKGYTKVDIDMLSKCMNDLLDNDKLLITLSDNGKKSWEHNYTWNRISYMYEEVFLDILNNKRKGF